MKSIKEWEIQWILKKNSVNKTFKGQIKWTKGSLKRQIPIRPIFIPERARARRADWAPGPGVLVLFPPVARSLIWRAVMPSSCSKTNWNDTSSFDSFTENNILLLQWFHRAKSLKKIGQWYWLTNRMIKLEFYQIHKESKNSTLRGPLTLHLAATSCAASIAAYGDDSSLSALTFIPPEDRKQRHK